MNETFLVYFMVLTIVLVVYYAVIIIYDLFGVKKGDGKDVEEFVVDNGDDLVDEEPTPVSVGKDGSVRVGSVDEQEDGDQGDAEDHSDEDVGDADQEPTLFDAPDDELAFNDYQDGDNLSDEQYAVLQEQYLLNMEPGEPDYQTVLDSTEFHIAMRMPRGVSTKIMKTFTSE